jgi:RimK family alpha-L-glutamate ligase
VLNPARALLAVHDKARTARLLAEEGVPHAAARVVRSADDPPPFGFPVVVKPRFGSWGVDVNRCADEVEYRELLGRLAYVGWFRRSGALVQPLLPSRGVDLRLVVAGGVVIGSGQRVAAPGEWRTNIALGGSRVPGRADPRERALALAAARAVGGDLVGVDLLPLPDGSRVVVELNGAVDFDHHYAAPGSDIYADAARALGLYRRREPGTLPRSTRGAEVRTFPNRSVGGPAMPSAPRAARLRQ